MTIDHDNWVDGDGIAYDESRYEPGAGYAPKCLKCDVELDFVGDAWGAVSRCPECEYTVMMV